MVVMTVILALRMLRQARHRWLTPVIPATQEADIRRIEVPRQPWQIVQKNPTQKRLVEWLKV
jgi:hypothetical protein